jgi:hypothetical protein
MKVSKIAQSVLVAGAMAFSSSAVVAFENDGTEDPPRESQAASGGLGISLLSAVIDADGTLVRGSGVRTVSLPGGNDYIVSFARNVRNCVYTAQIGNPDALGVPLPAFISVTGAAVDVKGVYVDIKDASGADVQRPFHLIVSCYK